MKQLEKLHKLTGYFTAVLFFKKRQILSGYKMRFIKKILKKLELFDLEKLKSVLDHDTSFQMHKEKLLRGEQLAVFQINEEQDKK